MKMAISLPRLFPHQFRPRSPNGLSIIWEMFIAHAQTCLFFLTLVGVEEGVGSSPPPRPTQFSLLSPRKSMKQYNAVLWIRIRSDRHHVAGSGSTSPDGILGHQFDKRLLTVFLLNRLYSCLKKSFEKIHERVYSWIASCRKGKRRVENQTKPRVREDSSLCLETSSKMMFKNSIGEPADSDPDLYPVQPYVKKLDFFPEINTLSKILKLMTTMKLLRKIKTM